MKKTYFIAIACSIILIGCKTEETPKGPLPEGFVLEELFSPNKYDMGSWVSLTTDDKGRVITSDQYGDLYRFNLPEKGDSLRVEDIEKIPLNIGFAQGLLWTNNALYVMVNRYTKQEDVLKSGLYKLSDTDGDDVLDSMEQLLFLDGAGEHGPHALIEGPDGLIYMVAGNHTLVPDSANYMFPDNFGEDNLNPVILDPRGHANHVKAPGGWVARIDKEGNNFEVVAVGFRNAYDIAFNEKGDLFTFDSDMEWDMGTPWYRPIRICHVFPGADFGWRTGSGKFPDYYADSWPGVVEIGQGSPTGVLFGAKLDFPDEYRESVYALDWSFGTIYRTQPEYNQGSYTGNHSEFFSRKSFPVTDIIAADGDMVFITGGRRLNSGLYRISYEGTPGEKDLTIQAGSMNTLLENQDLDKIWENLGSSTRHGQYVARVQLEALEDLSWIDRIATEDNPDIVIQSVIAMARITPSVDAKGAFGKLKSIEYNGLSERQKLGLLRAYQLLMIRFTPEDDSMEGIREQLSDQYPSTSHDLNRELLRVLAAAGDPTVIDKTFELFYWNDSETEGFIDEDAIERSEQYGNIISLIKRNSPQTRLLGYLESLSVLNAEWTPQQRETYYTAFNSIFTSTGGMSYKGFAREILHRSMADLSEEEREIGLEISGVELMNAGDEDLANLPKPDGPGENWTVEKLLALGSNLEGDIENGKRMYQAALCHLCHVVGGEGAPIGPDLSNLGSRFSTEDIINAIVDPNLSVVDQYAKSEITLTDNSVVTGRIVSMTEDTVIVNLNPFDPDRRRKIPTSMIESNELSTISTMPPGLLNRLNKKEVTDLLSYLASLGN